jgi:nicotinamide phosphoribosyltransferase
MMKLLWILGEKFGWSINAKGYRVLNHVRTLQGDKNDYDAIYNMIAATEGAKWSLDNIATFGMGGALLQASTRDTQKMAVKLSSLTDSEGKWRDVYKDPITDPGKGSKWGRFAVTLEHDEDTGEDRFVTTVLKQGQPNPEGNLLRPIYRNGEMLIHESFETVRARANAWMA